MSTERSGFKPIFPLLWTCLLFFSQAVNALCQEEGSSSSVTVITADDISREKPANIMELLRQKVGINENGSQVNMRGVNGIVVVVDNVPGTTIPTSLKPEDVDRIEIVRGAASSRYGASAMGGALVITTKEGKGDWMLDLIQGYGSFDRRYTKFIGSGSKGDWDFRVSGEENFMRRTYEAGPSDTPFSYMVYVEDDHSTRSALDARIGRKGERLQSDLNLNYSAGHSVSGRPNSWIDSKNVKARWTSKYKVTDWLELSPILSYDDWFVYNGVKDRGTGTDAAGLAPDRRVDTPSRAQAVELQSVIRGDASRLTLGLKYGVDEEETTIRDYYSNDLRFEYRNKLGQEAAFLLFEASGEEVSLDISGRYDRYRYYDVYINDTVNNISGESLVKESFSPKIGLKWGISDRFSVRGTVSTGFIPPSPYNLYYRDTSTPARVLNNPDLKPETSVTADIGLDMALPYGLNIGITPFYTLWKDKVDLVYTVDGTSSTQQPKNIGKSESIGVELQLNERFNERWSAFFNYTLNRTEITENESDKSVVGNEVPNMPRDKFNLGLTYQKREDLNMKAVWRYTGSRFLDQKNTVRDERDFLWEREAYSVVDLNITKFLRPGRLYLETLNLPWLLTTSLMSITASGSFIKTPEESCGEKLL